MIPCGSSEVLSKFNDPWIWPWVGSCGLMCDGKIRLRVSVSCGKSVSHSLSGKSVCVLQSLEMKLFLKVCIYLSAQFRKWIPAGVVL